MTIHERPRDGQRSIIPLSPTEQAAHELAAKRQEAAREGTPEAESAVADVVGSLVTQAEREHGRPDDLIDDGVLARARELGVNPVQQARDRQIVREETLRHQTRQALEQQHTPGSFLSIIHDDSLSDEEADALLDAIEDPAETLARVEELQRQVDTFVDPADEMPDPDSFYVE